MTTIAAIPSDLIKSKILHPYIRRNNYECATLLAARAACVSFWKALPIGEMLGIQEETAQWLLMGDTAPWRKSKHVKARLINGGNITVNHGGMTWFTSNGERMNATVCNGKDLRGYVTIFTPPFKTLPVVELVIVCDFKGVLRLQDSAFFLTAVVVVQNRLYLISSLGIVFQINIKELFEDATMKHHHKRLNFLRPRLDGKGVWHCQGTSG